MLSRTSVHTGAVLTLAAALLTAGLTQPASASTRTATASVSAVSSTGSTTVAASATSDVGGSISREEVIQRAIYWLNRGDTWYSQDQADAISDGDGHTFRPDCSGFVSMVWHMAKKSNGWDRNTSDFNSTTDPLLKNISFDSLEPGDAVLSSEHIELFDKWVDPSDHTQGIWTYAEHDYGRKTEHNTMSWSHMNDGFHAIRYTKITDGVVSPGASFSGDAKADLMVLGAEGDLSARINHDTYFDGGTTISKGWSNFLGYNGSGRLYLADFNGDGRKDLIVHGTEGDISVRINHGTYFDGGTTISKGWSNFLGYNGSGKLYFADFNGDAKADLIVLGAEGDISVRINHDTYFDGGTTISKGWSNFLGYNGSGRLYFADFNGDGKTDLIVHGAEGDISVRINHGTYFDGGTTISKGWSNFLGYNGSGKLYFADFNGDGKADLIVLGAEGDLSARINHGTYFDGGTTISKGWSNFLGYNGSGLLYLA